MDIGIFFNTKEKNLSAYVFRQLAKYPAYTEYRKRELRLIVAMLLESFGLRRHEMMMEFSFMRDEQAANDASNGAFDESPQDFIARNFRLSRSDARWTLEEIVFRCKNGIL